MQTIREKSKNDNVYDALVHTLKVHNDFLDQIRITISENVEYRNKLKLADENTIEVSKVMENLFNELQLSNLSDELKNYSTDVKSMNKAHGIVDEVFSKLFKKIEDLRPSKNISSITAAEINGLIDDSNFLILDTYDMKFRPTLHTEDYFTDFSRNYFHSVKQVEDSLSVIKKEHADIELLENINKGLDENLQKFLAIEMELKTAFAKHLDSIKKNDVLLDGYDRYFLGYGPAVLAGLLIFVGGMFWWFGVPDYFESLFFADRNAEEIL